MKKQIKRFLRSSCRKMGFEISFYKGDTLGENPYSDICKIILNKESPCLFDVGANIGQTAETLYSLFPNGKIHSFEPGVSAFKTLKKKTENYQNLTINNFALGSTPSSKVLFENEFSHLSSFLKPGESSWGKIKNEATVPVHTVDEYCEKKFIIEVDLLKIDTQGFDFEVLKGAKNLLNNNKIHLIYIEINFADLYKDLPSFDLIYKFLMDNDFKLVAFYKFYFHKYHYANWSDALFVNLNWPAPSK